jgi:hypothetical protein
MTTINVPPMTCMREDRVGAMWDVTATEQAMSGFVMFAANLTKSLPCRGIASGLPLIGLRQRWPRVACSEDGPCWRRSSHPAG